MMLQIVHCDVLVPEALEASKSNNRLFHSPCSVKNPYFFAISVSHNFRFLKIDQVGGFFLKKTKIYFREEQRIAFLLLILKIILQSKRLEDHGSNYIAQYHKYILCPAQSLQVFLGLYGNLFHQFLKKMKKKNNHWT